MLKIHDLFLRSFIAVFIILVAIISVIVFFWSKNLYIDQIEKSILSNINSISLTLDNINNIDNKFLKIKDSTDLRITLIDKDGKVLAETHKDKTSMENHATRKEIIDAKYNGIGKIIRYSETIDKDLLYVAKKIILDQKIYYLRISEDIDLIQKSFLTLTMQIIGIFSIFLMLAFIISYLLSRKIQDETNIILKALQNLNKKKSLPRDYEPFTQEFDTIYKLLKKVSGKLEKREKIKSKHTAKLAQSNKQKDEIISAISHEFKNPIAVIDGFAQTLLDDEDLPQSMRKKFLQKIEISASRMTQIIDKLRLSLKLEQNKEQLEYVNINLFNLASELSAELQDKYESRVIDILGNKDITVKVDKTLFSIALTNLIDNGLKYSDDKVIIKIYKDGISVIDSGVGIAENELEKITQKFYRVSNNGWNNSLGLGLHIVFSIIKIHGFTLDIKSKYHEGSEFTIKF